MNDPCKDSRASHPFTPSLLKRGKLYPQHLGINLHVSFILHKFYGYFTKHADRPAKLLYGHQPEKGEGGVEHGECFLLISHVISLHGVTAFDEGEHGLEVHDGLGESVLTLVSLVLQLPRLGQVLVRSGVTAERRNKVVHQEE